VPLPGITATKFGRVQSPPPPSRMACVAAHDGAPLREVEHEVPIPVLDQEDLDKQGIDVSKLVPGARKVTALGSCTCQAGTAHLAQRYTAAGRSLLPLRLRSGDGILGVTTTSTAAGREDEEFAVVLYHRVTTQTGDPASEWPPSDCGSSGYHVCAEAQRLGWTSGYRTGAGVHGALVLLQDGSVMQGAPWFNSWMQPDARGFVDGDGSWDAFQAAAASGVAGGHETLQAGIPQLAQTASGVVDLQQTGDPLPQ
jgi:hypothetical protein